MGDDESEDFDRLVGQLPGPPPMGQIRTTNVWIVEWLSSQDRSTGKLLYEWMQERRPSWAAYSPCRSKADVLAALERATLCAQGTKMVPVLHLEAHGDETGLEGPNGVGHSAVLYWSDLTEPLQRLNLATQCNLLVFIAACIGFAGIKAFHRGPRAPAVVLVGSDSPLVEANLLRATKEFYRRYMDPSPSLTDIAASASREAGTVFETEPFAVLAFESMIQTLIRDARPGDWVRRIDQIGAQIATLQLTWDQLFMIDLLPDNQQRFGVDMAAVVDALSRAPESMILAASGYAGYRPTSA